MLSRCAMRPAVNVVQYFPVFQTTRWTFEDPSIFTRSYEEKLDKTQAV